MILMNYSHSIFQEKSPTTPFNLDKVQASLTNRRPWEIHLLRSLENLLDINTFSEIGKIVLQMFYYQPQMHYLA